MSQDVLLIVDDDPAMRAVLEFHMDGVDCRIVHAEDGEKGLMQVRADRPSCILLDLDLPGMTGLEVMRRLKDDPATSAIPVIFISATDKPIRIAAAIDEGALDYITKPYDPIELRARIRNAFRIHRRFQTLAQMLEVAHALNRRQDS
jgi:DNA-binding response OmpR family regulator